MVATSNPTLAGLPDELIQQILRHVPPGSIPALEQVSQRFRDITSEPLLWRYYCVKHFRYWGEEHNIRLKLREYVADVDWKGLYKHRCVVDRTTRRIIDSILASQTDRIEKYQKIVDFGYDAKDTVMQQCCVEVDTIDGLARRYYSNHVQGCLHRNLAIREWSNFTDGVPITLERALAAFDMFVLNNGEGDFEYISDFLDDLANQIYCQTSGFTELTQRAKAVVIARFLRMHNLTGVKSDLTYQNLQNNFIGIALQAEDHPSLPLISVAIFCSVARRLSLDARPCAIPFHVYAMVSPPKGSSLDGELLQSNDGGNPMFLDPFRSAEETPVKFIELQLSAVGVHPASYPTFFRYTPTTDIVYRSAKNIMTSVREQSEHGSQHLARFASSLDKDSAYFGALWGLVLAGIPSDGDGDGLAIASFRQRHVLPFLLEYLQTHFPADVYLIERYLLPLFQHLPESGQLRETVRVVRTGDTMPKQVKKRTEDIAKRVKYKVGQVFQHRRYRYLAIITGWDVECGADELWIEQMEVDKLSKGRRQGFYHVLVEDETVRYVAEENIEIVRPELPHNFMALAGKHFKRWDKGSGSFVSNIRDEYPDD